jgi:hypothetical protein
VHRRLDEHETASRSLPLVPAGWRIRCALHRWPFHRSATDVLVARLPTAVHRRLVEHETPFSGPEPPIVWRIHVVPFQRHAIGPTAGSCPTAMQALRDVHDTPDREVVASLGPGCPAHWLPFQCCARGSGPSSA